MEPKNRVLRASAQFPRHTQPLSNMTGHRDDAQATGVLPSPVGMRSTVVYHERFITGERLARPRSRPRPMQEQIDQ